MNSLPAINPVTTASGKGVTAVLGPTNTGKTHLAIERMLGHRSGMIGLPLRLLAREVYQRIAARVGKDQVALITGEEKIIPPEARYQVCTVEAMPQKTDADFVAIDEAQLAADLERGHVFTDRLINLRGQQETMLLGAATLRPLIEHLLPGINVITRPRMSMLTYAGGKKITRLPQRSAIVAFSSDEVYAIAELVRRQRGGAAVVLGSLSPRTRNAQVEIYQSGDVDFLVATDAIGMGLNLDVNHVAFAQDHKFDGHQHRRLTAAEFAQIAGRAGRHTRDGTFGVTSRVDPLEDELVAALESHLFAPLKNLQWRNRQLDLSSPKSLIASLEQPSSNPILARAQMSTDQRALEHLIGDADVRDRVNSEVDTRLLWDVCQVPDYRRIAPANHADMLGRLYLDIAEKGHIDPRWFAEQVAQTDTVDGDIDTISNRIAHVRTWTFVSNRSEWLDDPQHWQQKTAEIEDRLSDALHERLTQRFVDRRTSVLMKRLRENAMLEAEISSSGEVTVEGHHVGSLQGFRFTAESGAEGADAKAARNAAQKALVTELSARATRLGAAANADIVFGSDGTLRWQGEPVGKLLDGEEALSPRVLILADEHLNGAERDKVVARLERWINHHIETVLKQLVDLKNAEDLPGIARGVAYRLVENFGVIARPEIAEDIRSLDQDMRGKLRRLGVRFGAYHIFVPLLLKPAPARLATFLWALKNDALEANGVAEVPEILATGRTSTNPDADISQDIYRISGYRVLRKKAVRVDILERLADLIRPAIGWRPDSDQKRPDGAYLGNSFIVTPAMLSILGATHDDMIEVLKSLGYRQDNQPAGKIDAQLAEWADVATKSEAETQSPSDPAQAAEQTDVQDAKPETDADPVKETANEVAGPAAEVDGSKQNEGASEQTDASSSSEASNAIAAEDASDTAQEPDESAVEVEEERIVAVWRPGRSPNEQGNRQRRGHRSNSQSRQSTAGQKDRSGKPSGQRGRDGQKRNDRNKGKGGQQRHGSSHGRKQDRQPKPLDPDSPFAKLAALKADLERRDG
ncbi:MAG: helicase-related protein [Pseudomonadota bacterium]